MTAIAALTLADGAATPVNHTFNPVNIDSNGVAKWADRSSGVSVGFPVVTFSNRAPAKGGRAYRVTFKVTVPVTETIAPSTFATKAFDLIFNGEFVLPERSTSAQRADALAYAKNLLSHAVITAAVKDLEAVF